MSHMRPKQNLPLAIGGVLLAAAGAAFLLLLFGSIFLSAEIAFGAPPLVVVIYVLSVTGVLGVVLTLIGIVRLLRDRPHD